MDVEDRKQVEINRKVRALKDEFDRWVEASKVEASKKELRKHNFRKHNSQILAVTKRMEAHVEKIEKILKNDSGLSTAREMSRILLAIHRIWEFFRAKLAQRYEEAFVKHLEIADEFAWLCYRPFYDRKFDLKDERPFKEPPLVFLNGGSSPFVLTRDVGFQAEAVPRELIQDSNLQKAMAQLPFPVIGIPWHQIVQLSEALVIGHEVGHSVEGDLGLKDEMEAIIDQSLKRSHGQDRKHFWLVWRSELFADVCGCLAGGPAFVGALCDFLLADTKDLEKNPQQDSYPPPGVRVRFNFDVLRAIGFKTESRRFLDEWSALYPLPAELECFASDGKRIAFRFVHTPLKGLDGSSLCSVLTFTEDQHGKAMEQARLAKEGYDLRDYKDFRLTLAAVRLAYETDPTTFFRPVKGKSPSERLYDKLKALLSNDLRAGETVPTKKKRALADKRNHDRGEEEFELLRAWMAKTATYRG
jgi:hypothetical protein